MRVFLIISITLFFTNVGFSQEVSLNNFIEETQVDISGSNEIKLGWWLPIEFWKLSLKGDSSISVQDKAVILEVLNDYMIIGVIDGEIGTFGGVTYVTEDSISQGLELSINENIIVGPTEYDDLTPVMQVMLASFKPMLKSMLGEVGENFHFYVYLDKDKKGERLADPYEKGVLKLVANDEIYEWNLPIESLLAEKKCPVDNKFMNGAWDYCPYHGKELIEINE